MATKKKTTTSKVKRAVKKVVAKARAKPAKTKKAPAKKAAPPRKPAPAKKPAPMASLRKQGMTVDQYILSVKPPQRAVLEMLRDCVMTCAPGTSLTIKWGQPVFENNGPIAWMKAFGKHVGFGFWRGAELSDPDGILEGKGDRMRHVKITDPTQVPVAKIDALIREAVALNQAKGDPSRRA